MSNFQDKDFGVKWYTDSDGLPQNSVKQIFKDSYGFTWLLTQNGLVRYDGRNFKVFNSKNTNIYSNKMMYAHRNIAGDSIAVYNEFGEALLISRRKAFPLENPSQKYIKTFASTPGIYTPDSIAGLPKKYIIPVAGNMYFSVEGDTVNFHTGYLTQKLSVYFPDHTPGYFFALNNRLYHLTETGHYTAITAEGINENELAIPDDDGYITGCFYNPITQQTFVHTRQNLYILQIQDTSLSFKKLLTGFDFGAENSIISAYYDQNLDIIYLGSATRGLGIIKKYPFRSVNTRDTERVQYALANYGPNKILTASGALIRTDQLSGQKPDIPWDNDKQNLIVDTRGYIWTKKHRTLFRFSKDSTNRDFQKWTFPYPIEQISAGRNNRIWIATDSENDEKHNSGSYLYYMDPLFDAPQNLRKVSFGIQYILQTTDNMLWLGSLNGLYKLDLIHEKLDQIRSLDDKQITSLHASISGEIWITTSTKGIFLYKDGTLTSFPPDTRGYMLSSHCIVEDDQGYLWITTGKGLFQASKKKMIDYASGKMKQVYYHFYDKNSGFLSNEFMGGCQPCGIQLQDGHIALPSLNGIVIFDPKKVKPELPNGTIYVDEVRTADNDLAIHQDTLTLKRNFGRVHIELVSPYYDNPYNLNMEFKLEDENVKNWEHIEDGQTITFSQLPPGQHTLVIRKMNSFYSYYIHKRIVLVVPPYFWETDWFLILVCLAAPIIIFYSIKLRIKYVRYKNILLKKKIIESTRHLRNTIRTLRITKDKLKQQTAIQEKLIASISHDIRSPLRFMVDTGEYLYANYDTGNKKMIREGIRSMYTASVKIHEFISEILDYSKARMYEGEGNTPAEDYDLQHLIGEKISLFAEIANSQRTRIYNYVPYHFTTSVNKHLLSIIIHNILDNAVKNTQNGKITIYAFVSESRLRIVMEDTGRGIPQKELQYYQSLLKPDASPPVSLDTPSKSLGIKIIMDLLIILNGKIEIKSTLNRGTRITLSFPVETNS